MAQPFLSWLPLINHRAHAAFWDMSCRADSMLVPRYDWWTAGEHYISPNILTVQFSHSKTYYLSYCLAFFEVTRGLKNDIAIIGFGFRMIWRIMWIEEDIIGSSRRIPCPQGLLVLLSLFLSIFCNTQNTDDILLDIENVFQIWSTSTGFEEVARVWANQKRKNVLNE